MAKLDRRARIALSELLKLLYRDPLKHFVAKHGLELDLESYHSDLTGYLLEILPWENELVIANILQEAWRRKNDFRSETSPRWKWDARWNELEQCLPLSGYSFSSEGLRASEPTINGQEPLEDDLSMQLVLTGLHESQDVKRLIDASAAHFVATPPDHNACLTDMRVALETLARNIAEEQKKTHHGVFDRSKWGEILTYLRTSALITIEEEKGLAGVYGFLSPGAHQPVSKDEMREMSRLGRNMALSMCYFLCRRYNG